MSNIIAGIDISKWATASNHEKVVQDTYNKISSLLNNIKNNDHLLELSINNIIQNNPVVKKMGGSPITAKMILRSAQKHNVDPAIIMAIAHVDSHYGTVGKGAKTKNPGNWGNDDAGNTKSFNTWEEGLDIIPWQLNRYRQKQSNYVEKIKEEPKDVVESLITPIFKMVSKPEEASIPVETPTIESTENLSELNGFIRSLSNKKKDNKLVSSINKSGFVELGFLQKGGNIEEIIIYGKKKYKKALQDQQEKYLAEMAKYKQDSAQWVKANKDYQDSLNVYNGAINNWNKEIKLTQEKKDKELKELLNSPYLTDKEKESTRKYLEEGKNRYYTYEDITKRHGKSEYDYNIPLAKDLIPTEYDYHGLNLSGRTISKNNYPGWIDNYTASIIKNNNKIQPIGVVSTSEGGATGVFKKPNKINIPQEPIKPIITPVKYNSKYENLKMRSLWANQAKADTTAKIGVLNPSEYNDSSKGFTIGEAMKFPDEIKNKFNIPYIYNQIQKKQKGGTIKERLATTIDPTQDINFWSFVNSTGSFIGNNKWDTTKDSVANAAWRKRLGLNYDKKYLIDNPDGSVRLPDNIASQLNVDTISIKNQIKDFQNIINKNPKSDSASNSEGNLQYLNTYLDKLRTMYKGKPVVVNEYEARKNAFTNDGYMNPLDTPFNLMRNFTLKYDPIKKQISYYDIYDFNKLELITPGKPFEIKGIIPKNYHKMPDGTIMKNSEHK